MAELPATVQAWIGKVVVTDDAAVCVERGAVENFCAAVEDGNPLYWDDTAAQPITGGVIAHPALLSAWNRPHEWSPGRDADKPVNRPLELHFMVKDALELPRGIVSTQEYEWRTPVRPGDRLQAEQSLREVSEEKTNKLGTGRSWVIDVTYRNQHGAIVGIESVSFFGYRRD